MTGRLRTAPHSDPAVEVVDEATPAKRRQPAWAAAILFIAAAAYLLLFAQAIVQADDEMLQGLTVAPILFALTIPLAFRMARAERDETLATIVLAGIATKLVVSYVQFKIAYGYFEGRVDAAQYDDAGRTLAPQFRRLDFSTNIGELVGTGYTKIFTGAVYAIFGTSRVTGFMVFAWVGFLGLLLLARAFRIGIPTGDFRRYLIAVLFLPSLLYWPSTIGKEAIMILGIGLSAYGAARLLSGRTAGLLPLAAGIFVILLIRPHVALLVFAALAFAFLVRKAPARSYAAPAFRVVGGAMVVVVAFFLVAETQTYLDRSLKTTDSSVSSQLEATSERTSEAGSSFTPATVNTPLDIPLATVTVFFRPFPYEANGFAGLLSSAEGILVAALLIVSLDRVRSVPRMFRTSPYLAFAITYTLAFVVAFSRFANFGILARQRVQAIPFLLVLIALPKYRVLVDADGGERTKRPKRAGRTSRPPALPGPSGTRRRLRPVRTRTPVSSGPAFTPPVRAGH